MTSRPKLVPAPAGPLEGVTALEAATALADLAILGVRHVAEWAGGSLVPAKYVLLAASCAGLLSRRGMRAVAMTLLFIRGVSFTVALFGFPPGAPAAAAPLLLVLPGVRLLRVGRR
jgi:hypothetical protein